MSAQVFERRHHRKTRTGCIPCKNRHRKCNEKRPRCSGCVRHNTDCIYASNRPEPLQQSFPDTSGLNEDNLSLSPGVSIAPTFSSDEIGRVNGAEIRTLKLLHHFSTVTCFTLAYNQAQFSLWQTYVPHLAFEFDFLLYGILSFTALHLGHLYPTDASTYSLIAARYQDLALPSFRSAMNSIDKASGPAIFGYAALLAVTMLASHSSAFESERPINTPFSLHESHSGDNHRPLDSILEWLRLLRGLAPVIQQVGHLVHDSPLAPLVEDYRIYSNRDCSFNSNDARLERLSSLFVPPRIESQHIQAYLTTLRELRQIFAVALLPDLSIHLRSIALAWPCIIPQLYITHLERRQPEAIIILAYYAVFLLKLDSAWFARGSALRFVDECKRSLEEEHAGWALAWMDWPIELIHSQRG